MKPTAPCAVTLPAHKPHASHRRPRRKMCGRPAVCFLNPAAQRAPQAAFPRTLPQCQARCANCLESRSSLACARHAVTRACETIPPPLGVAACRTCHAPDAAMFPLGSRRASRAPVHDHSRPIPPTSCRDARKLAPANPRPPRSLPPTPPPLVHQTASPSRPDRSHRKPRAKRPPPPKLAPARASHSAGSMQYPRRHKLTPPRAAILPALCDAVSPPLQPPLPGAPLTPTPGPSAVPAALAV